MSRRRWRGTTPTDFGKIVADDLGKQTRATALQALTGVIERSPVDSGAFRGNHRVSVGSPDNGYSLDETDRTGGQALSRGSNVIGQIQQPLTLIYIQNNLPYAGVLENGSSSQAPQGVYAVTFNNLKELSQ